MQERFLSIIAIPVPTSLPSWIPSLRSFGLTSILESGLGASTMLPSLSSQPKISQVFLFWPLRPFHISRAGSKWRIESGIGITRWCFFLTYAILTWVPLTHFHPLTQRPSLHQKKMFPNGSLDMEQAWLTPVISRGVAILQLFCHKALYLWMSPFLFFPPKRGSEKQFLGNWGGDGLCTKAVC